ncbi:MBL fold metallo-hydrolase [Dermatophilus congolensis]|uniref:MBL fold metallo-hydrolase n=1 Tax=Dermatophilus congolensis TaxID=1863 RepID=UPI001AAF2003|nr:MBL fold metallo-hydrolase [Dermatophilus congolensis]MBO3129506.1 MBL fold metallo-hydrolase [Dermatophilus congolensis]MBO3131861.1 MBL fold metallo-hydrolase [Dermatophilus congolensis]MBO3133982.1 MBL fold metallo-hydrolase [Dermatophilus congolensis]MBO3136213.1 MBL fold metallo-hydrolase [Dermatophilus congolensis]MBO3138459.1 MBL fold metallo-hydrolase [Dermatophilus congolensis]
MQDTHSHYTGEVVSGGPSDVRDLGTLTIRKASVGPMNNNVYLLTPSDGSGSLLIDAAADAARINGLIAESAAPVATIVTTHRHPDHTGALVEIAEATGAETIAGVRDAAALPLPADRTVDHGDTITVGEHTVDVIALRGHTPGAIALAWTAPDGSVHLFTGDSLFPGGVGKTDSPEDFASLIDDVEQRLFDVYDDDAWVYPGHGSDTTIGTERPSLPEWRQRGW